MPSLSAHQSSRSTKLMLIGDSGTGKTGALTSLVAEGYRLRILDFDNGLDSLVAHCRKTCPQNLDAVQFVSYRDKFKGMAAGTPIYDGPVTAFANALKALDQWPEPTAEGQRPAAWADGKTIVVIDSLSHMGNAAFAWARSMNPGAKEPRQWFYSAQQALESVIGLLTNEAFSPSVIVTAHVTYDQTDEGGLRGFPTSIGRALGPKLMSYFNNVAQVVVKGSGATAKREILTAPTALLALKNPAPFAMAPALPIETGLATFFKTVRGEK